MPHSSITVSEFRPPSRRESKVVAVFCFRYDASLVPDLIENIRPFVHAAIAFDDRAASEALTPEPPRRAALHAAARAIGADWIFAADPDERYEIALARVMPALTAPTDRPVLWRFRTRELFSMTEWRADGVWGNKAKIILYPAATTLDTTDQPLHGAWVRDDPSWIKLDSGLNLYHLRHVAPHRTQHRRDTWAAADPHRSMQAIGWDYLSDMRGARFETIPPHRQFQPDGPPDDGPWALADTASLGPAPPDPIDCMLNRVAVFRRQGGASHAAHVVSDLIKADPDDTDLRLVCAALHLRAQEPEAALAALPTGPAASLHLTRLLRGRALLARGDRAGAARTAGYSQTALHAALLADATRDNADFTAPNAAWRAHVPGGQATIAEGPRNGAGPLAVIVISHVGGPSPRWAVASVAEQSDATEIILVRSGDARLPDLGPLNHRVRRIAVAASLYVGAARNIGILASRGEYLAFLAGDCRLEPGWTEGRLARHAAGALSVSTPVLPERPGTLIGDLVAAHVFSRRDPWLTADLANHYGRSYARRIFAEVGLFAPGLRVIEDTEFNARVNTVALPVWAPEISIRHSDPRSLFRLLADIRRRAARAAAYGHPPEGPAQDWIVKLMAARRAMMRRVTEENPVGPPSRLRHLLDEMAHRSYERGLRDSDVRLSGATALYRAATALPEDRAAEAAALLAQAVALLPQTAAYHTAHGRALHAAGEVEASVTAFEAALAINPSDGAALQALVVTQRDLGRQAEALFKAEALSVIVPDSFHVARSTAFAALAAGRPGIALFHAQRALAINPSHSGTHQFLARIYSGIGNTAMAERRNRMADEIAAATARRTKTASTRTATT